MGQQGMNNPKTLTTLGIQDTRQSKTKPKKKHNTENIVHVLVNNRQAINQYLRGIPSEWLVNTINDVHGG